MRTGVAPDHPEVKQVTNDFEQVATDPRFGYLGNVRVGTDVSVEELFSFYDAVVLAYGASSDRAMGVPGEDLRNVTSARAFVNWYNGHPDFRDFAPNLDAEDVVIIGQGNVAIDCARILTKTRDELKETDIAAHALDALSRSKVKRVHVVGRRGHVQAAMTMKELREVTRLEDADFVVSAEELARGRTAASVAELETQRARKRMDALLAEQAALAPAGKRRQLRLRFLLNPSACLPSASDPGAVGGMEFDITALEGAAEAQKAVPTGKKEVIPAGLVLKSIGYKSVPLPGVPFNAKKATVNNVKGRVVAEGEAGAPVPGLYCAGWLKRGPSGIIGTNITDARETVAALLEDKAAGKLRKATAGEGGAGLAGLKALLTQRGKNPAHQVSWAGWRALDAAELARGAAAGKSREKFVSVPEMLDLAAKTQAQ